MKNLFLFLKGLFIGIGKIIPGVSGSLIAVILGVYERAIYSINHWKDDFWNSITFLIPLGLGILLSVVFFSHVLLFFLSHYYFVTMFFFCGLIFGEVPSFQKKVFFSCWYDSAFFLLSFLLPFSFSFFSFSLTLTTPFFVSLIIYFGLGFLDAATMIIPGISGTSLFLMLGVYESVLSIYSNPLQNLFITGSFSVGLLFGVFFVSSFVEFLFQTNRNRFLICIDGLLWSSLVYLFFSIIPGIHFSNFFFLGFVFLIGFLLTYRISK